jgi:hypothetical protein
MKIFIQGSEEGKRVNKYGEEWMLGGEIIGRKYIL